MVRSAPSCVESKNRHPSPRFPLFGTLGESCPCGCGGKTFRWAEGAPLAVCFRTTAGVRELILRAPLASAQKHILHVFLHHTRDQGECWPSEQRLLMGTGVRSRQTLSTHKKALRELGILDWLRPGHPENPRSCALYSLSWEALQAWVETLLEDPSARSGARAVPRSSRVALATGTPAPESFVAEATKAPAEAPPVTPTVEVVPEVAQESPAICPVFEEEDLVFTLDEALLADDGIEVSAVLPAVEPREQTLPSTAAEPCEPAESSAPSQEEPPTSLPAAVEPPSSFEVPMMLVWNLWREAYQRAYGRPYVQTAADRPASQEIASACVAAVLHREQRAGVAPAERLVLAQAYLRHVFDAFLKRAGRRDFLRERRHPLSLLPADLNALGEPWAKERKVAPEPAPLPPPLPREEQLARCRQVKQALAEGRVTARPRILKNG